MSILSTSGRIAIAEVIFSRTLHLAWGRGDGAWVNPPAESGDETQLINEIARRKVTQVSYVVPDPSGVIVLPEGSFSLSIEPTRHVYTKTDFDYSEAIGEAIREIGLFSGTVTQAGLPIGQQYFLPNQITKPGRLIYVKNFEPIPRLPSARERFEIVLSF